MINELKKLQLAIEKINNESNDFILFNPEINEFTKIISQLEKLDATIEPKLDIIRKLPSMDRKNYDLRKLHASLDNADNVIIPLMEIYITLTKSVENIYKLDDIVTMFLSEKLAD